VSTLERSRESDTPEVPQDLKHVLDVGDKAVGQLFQIAERLDAKAKNQVTVAATWFAVVQAVAGVAYAAKPDRPWLYALLGATAVGGVALLATFFFSYLAWRPRDEKQLTHSGFRSLADGALERNPKLAERLILYYQNLIYTRSKNNENRVRWLGYAEVAWWVSVISTFGELIIASCARLFG
jgi:hypothetical protein